MLSIYIYSLSRGNDEMYSIHRGRKFRAFEISSEMWIVREFYGLDSFRGFAGNCCSRAGDSMNHAFAGEVVIFG